MNMKDIKNFKPVKITKGVYKLWTFNYRFFPDETKRGAWTECKSEIHPMESWVKAHTTEPFRHNNWGFSTAESVNHWHVDARGYNPNGKDWKYMIICMLTNYQDEGTEILLPSKDIIITKPWSVYLLKWDVQHRAPTNAHPRICLKWYFNPKGRF